MTVSPRRGRSRSCWTADTTGIEPDFVLVKYKALVGGGEMTITNTHGAELALRTLGYGETRDRPDHGLRRRATARRRAPGLRPQDLPVFDVAVGQRAISPAGHLQMMAAVQPFLGRDLQDGQPAAEATVDDIAEAVVQAWRLGVKALAVYRDDSKTAQALRTDAQEVKEIKTKAELALSAGEEIFTQSEVDELITAAVEKAVARAKAHADEPLRKRMPRERQSLTHKFSLGGHEGYITAGMYEDGTVGEIFLTDIGKELDAARDDELVRHGDLDRAAVRRAAGDPGAQVRLHALRAGGDHHLPGDPVREVDAGLHHALARFPLPGRRHPGGARHPHEEAARRRPPRTRSPAPRAEAPARPTAATAARS